MVWLRDLANKWMWDYKSVEAVIEKLAVEQFMDGMPPPTASCLDAVENANLYGGGSTCCR